MTSSSPLYDSPKRIKYTSTSTPPPLKIKNKLNYNFEKSVTVLLPLKFSQLFDYETVDYVLSNLKIGQCFEESERGQMYECTLLKNSDIKFALKFQPFNLSWSHGRYKRLENQLKTFYSAMNENISYPLVNEIAIWEQSEGTYILMDFINGQKVSKFNFQNSKMYWKLLKDMCNALKIFEEENFVHLDIKPENIMESKEEFILIDFGLIHSNRENLDESVEEGDAQFLAPELLQINNYDELKFGKCDIFSLGKTLLNLIHKVDSKLKDHNLLILYKLAMKMIDENPVKRIALHQIQPFVNMYYSLID